MEFLVQACVVGVDRDEKVSVMRDFHNLIRWRGAARARARAPRDTPPALHAPPASDPTRYTAAQLTTSIANVVPLFVTSPKGRRRGATIRAAQSAKDTTWPSAASSWPTPRVAERWWGRWRRTSLPAVGRQGMILLLLLSVTMTEYLGRFGAPMTRLRVFATAGAVFTRQRFSGHVAVRQLSRTATLLRL